MEFKVNVLSAQDLKYVNIVTAMEVYAVVSINENMKQKTPVDKDSGCNPEWNHTIKFIIKEADIHENDSYVVFVLKSRRLLGDRDIGTVQVPIKELFDLRNKVQQSASYSVMLPNGKLKGVLNFSYTFEGYHDTPPRLPGPPPLLLEPPPPVAHHGYVPPPGPYLPPHWIAGYQYPPPPPHGGGSYPHHNYQQAPGHVYHHHQSYGANDKSFHNNGMGTAEVGLGIAAAGGVAGGLLISNMVGNAFER